MPGNRPGLATGFGDRVVSSMEYTDFQRSSSKPVSFDSLRYNDSEGSHGDADGSLDAEVRTSKISGRFCGMGREEPP